MTTKCFALALNDETAIAMQTIALAVPCFISLDTNKSEYTISARNEDWVFIEKVLAPIV